MFYYNFMLMTGYYFLVEGTDMNTSRLHMTGMYKPTQYIFTGIHLYGLL